MKLEKKEFEFSLLEKVSQGLVLLKELPLSPKLSLKTGYFVHMLKGPLEVLSSAILETRKKYGDVVGIKFSIPQSKVEEYSEAIGAVYAETIEISVPELTQKEFENIEGITPEFWVFMLEYFLKEEKKA